ncbi:hypothetical protein EJB05_19769, partial [Eragrostis curvula]
MHGVVDSSSPYRCPWPQDLVSLRPSSRLCHEELVLIVDDRVSSALPAAHRDCGKLFVLETKGQVRYRIVPYTPAATSCPSHSPAATDCLGLIKYKAYVPLCALLDPVGCRRRYDEAWCSTSGSVRRACSQIKSCNSSSNQDHLLMGGKDNMASGRQHRCQVVMCFAAWPI